jgi:hypothetical protein
MLIAAVCMGALQFTLERSYTSLYYRMGICYYLLVSMRKKRNSKNSRQQPLPGSLGKNRD